MDQFGLRRSQPPIVGLTHVIPVSTAALQLLVTALTRLGVAYGPADEQIIAEDMLNGHKIQASLRRDEVGWTLTVRGDPPLDAIISLYVDRYSRHAAFSAEGEAQFSEIPEAWLQTKIDLVVVLPAAASP